MFGILIFGSVIDNTAYQKNLLVASDVLLAVIYGLLCAPDLYDHHGNDTL